MPQSNVGSLYGSANASDNKQSASAQDNQNVAQVMLYDATYTAWQATLYDPTWHVRLVAICYIVFTVRCYASTILDMALCLSARHKSEFY